MRIIKLDSYFLVVYATCLAVYIVGYASIYKVVGQMFIAAGSGFSDWTRTTIRLERN